MASIGRLTAPYLVLAAIGYSFVAQAQKVYVCDNGTRAENRAWDVKVFENGTHRYVIADAQGVTFSPRAVGFDSTGAIYIASLESGGVQNIVKYSENSNGTEVFSHTQYLTSFGATGGQGSCNWGIGDVRQLDVDLSDDSVVVANSTGVWNTSCPSPGGRGPGAYGYIARYRGVNPSVIDQDHTRAVAVQGLAWLTINGSRSPNEPTITIDQITGDVYVGSEWGQDSLVSTQVLERFSRNLVLLDSWDLNDPFRGVPDDVTNRILKGLAVTTDGSVWFNDVTDSAGMGGWGNMGSVVKYDSSGQFVTRREGQTVMSGTERNNFNWTGGMDIDENDILYYADTDRVLKLSGQNGDFIGFAFGDTSGQWNTNIYGAAAFSGRAGALESIAVGPEPPTGSAVWTE